VPHVEQELHTLPEHMRSSPVIREFRVARSLFFCVMFYRSLSFFFWSLYCLFFFYLRIQITFFHNPLASSNFSFFRSSSSSSSSSSDLFWFKILLYGSIVHIIVMRRVLRHSDIPPQDKNIDLDS